jgi:signal transduction histidine kinase
VIDGELRGSFDDVIWDVGPEAERACDPLPPLTAEVLFYAAREAIRNAARYGRTGGAPLRLTESARDRDGLTIAIEDNGAGIDRSRPSDGGSGSGLALHGTMMAVVGGALVVESEPGAFTRVVLRVRYEG